jgi:hypothetical protein
LNGVFPTAIVLLRACRASATVTLIFKFPETPWASRWLLLRYGPGWARDVTRVVPLGCPSEVLEISARDRRLFGSGPVIAVRFNSS